MIHEELGGYGWQISGSFDFSSPYSRTIVRTFSKLPKICSNAIRWMTVNFDFFLNYFFKWRLIKTKIVFQKLWYLQLRSRVRIATLIDITTKKKCRKCENTQSGFSNVLHNWKVKCSYTSYKLTCTFSAQTLYTDSFSYLYWELIDFGENS